MNDFVALVNEHDVVLGQLDKYQAHRHPARLHRAISIWMFDERGRVLMQKRSQQKIVGAGWWGNTVCGNNWPGESYEECARRRLHYELGISNVVLAPLIKFHYQVYANELYGEHEMDQVFVSHVFSETISLMPNPDEVSEVKWVDSQIFYHEMEEQLSEYSHTYHRPYPSAQQTVGMSLAQLQETTHPLRCSLLGKDSVHDDGQDFVVPWTVIMLQLPAVRALFLA